MNHDPFLTASPIYRNAIRLGARSGSAFEVRRRPLNPVLEGLKFFAAVGIPLAAIVVAHMILQGT